VVTTRGRDEAEAFLAHYDLRGVFDAPVNSCHCCDSISVRGLRILLPIAT